MQNNRTLTQGKDPFFSGRTDAGEKKWYIFYLRPRSEKMVYKQLTHLGYELFLPMTQTLKVWKNRQKKKVELPLFPGYIFVYTFEHELYRIRGLPKVVTCVSGGGKPATITDKEIEGIRRMLGLERPVTVETNFRKGEQVRIVSGPLTGYCGVLCRQNGKTRFGIRLEAINHTVFIDIRHSAVEKH